MSQKCLEIINCFLQRHGILLSSVPCFLTFVNVERTDFPCTREGNSWKRGNSGQLVLLVCRHPDFQLHASVELNRYQRYQETFPDTENHTSFQSNVKMNFRMDFFSLSL